jgi:glutamate--cysteine ligase
MLGFAYDEDFGYRRYVEWALDVPMFFVVRGGEYRPANGMTFRRFMESDSATSAPRSRTGSAT